MSGLGDNGLQSNDSGRDERSIPAARPVTDFAWEEVGEELVILDAETLQYHALNATAVWIWQACDGAATPNRLSQELSIPVEVVESTVAELGAAGLLQSPSDTWDSTLNRRRAAKLIAAGLVGAVGLPVIKSITAPDAASAASIGQCQFGFTAGAWLCGVCRFFDCGCETVTSGGSGYCCVCGGSGARVMAASGGPSYDAFFAAVGKAQSGQPLTWTDDSYEVIEEEPVDTTANEGVSAPAGAEEQAPAIEAPPEVQPESTAQREAPAQAPEDSSASEAVETGSGAEESTEQANG